MKLVSFFPPLLSVALALSLLPSTRCQDTGGSFLRPADQRPFTGSVVVTVASAAGTGTADGTISSTQYSTASCSMTLADSNTVLAFYLQKGSIPTSTTSGCAAAGTGASCSVSGTVCETIYYLVSVTAATAGSYTVSYDCSGSTCFSEEASVHILGRGPTPMKHLSVGDKILVGETYETVYGFAHLEKARTAEFLQIHSTEAEGPLEVTGEHLLLVNEEYLPAKFVQVGDTLSGQKGKSVVTKIDKAFKNGLYAPLTPSGKLLVNGVMASAYVSIQKGSPKNVEFKAGSDMMMALSSWLSFSHHDVSHMALSPVRIACMGISPKLCSNDFINEETGLPPIIALWFKLVEFFDQQQSIVVQIFLLVLFACICGPFYFVESIFGATLALPGLIIMAAVMAAVHNKNTAANATDNDCSTISKKAD